METFLTLTFLFMVGATNGWGIEILFRRIFTAKRWINPGFLTGPWLPLYGFGLATLYALARIDLSFIDNEIVRTIILVLIMGIIITLIEYIAGLIFIKGLKTKLWDYSDRWGNIQGIICPLFSLFWLIASALYILLLDKYVVSLASWFKGNIWYSFFVGIFYGMIIIDFAHSINLVSKIRKIAKENNVVVKWEMLKQTMQMHHQEVKEKFSYVFPFKSKFTLKESIENYLETIKNKKK